jgi:hypothetical protein
MFRRLALAGALVAATLSFAAAPAATPAGAAVVNGQMFTVEWEGGLYSVDPATGATTFVADTGVGSVTGVVWDEATGTLLAVNYDGGCNLTRIDPTTGGATVVGMTGHDDCTAFDRDPSDGTLYAAFDAGVGSNLMTIDPSTGASSVIDTVHDGGTDVRVASLAFVGGTLYAFDYDGNVYSVSTANAEATLVKADIIGGDDVMGANVDCAGTLYGSSEQVLFTIDLTSGTSNEIGPMFEGDLFSENLTVACGIAPPPEPPVTPPTTPTAPAPTAAPIVAGTPRFTG